MSLEIRPYAPGDERAILELFLAAFGQPMSEEYWRWRFLRNPAAPDAPVIHLMWDGPTLAGHYAVSPVRMSIGGATVLGALSMTTMTHPDYRGRGIFTQLAESVYAELTAAGYALVYGFPNEASHFGFVRQLGWSDVYQIPLLSTSIRPVKADGDEQRIDRVSDEDAMLFSAGVDGSRARVLREAAYLNWRYVDQPGRDYALFVSRGTSAGAAVCKIYRSDAGAQCDVTEMAAENTATVLVLLRGIGEFAKENGADRINAWADWSSDTFAPLERFGFQHKAPITWFGFRALADGSLQDRLAALRSWHLSMGDSDVY